MTFECLEDFLSLLCFSLVSLISTNVISFLELMEILSICNKNSSNKILGNVETKRESLHVDRRTNLCCQQIQPGTFFLCSIKNVKLFEIKYYLLLIGWAFCLTNSGIPPTSLSWFIRVSNLSTKSVTRSLSLEFICTALNSD